VPSGCFCRSRVRRLRLVVLWKQKLDAHASIQIIIRTIVRRLLWLCVSPLAAGHVDFVRCLYSSGPWACCKQVSNTGADRGSEDTSSRTIQTNRSNATRVVSCLPGLVVVAGIASAVWYASRLGRHSLRPRPVLVAGDRICGYRWRGRGRLSPQHLVPSSLSCWRLSGLPVLAQSRRKSQHRRQPERPIDAAFMARCIGGLRFHDVPERFLLNHTGEARLVARTIGPIRARLWSG